MVATSPFYWDTNMRQRKCSPTFKEVKIWVTECSSSVFFELQPISESLESTDCSVSQPHRISESVDVGQRAHHPAVHTHIFFFSSSSGFFFKFSSVSFWFYSYLCFCFPLLYIVSMTFYIHSFNLNVISGKLPFTWSVLVENTREKKILTVFSQK